MLKLVHENRSGNRLEIVILTYNEEPRIGNFLEHYGKEFDVVLLDDGSTDGTVQLAIDRGATIFRRTVEHMGENHFVYYVNEATASGLCFYMLADEYCDKQALRFVAEKLNASNCVILGKRVDWAYGKRLNSPVGAPPRGMRRGMAIFNPNNLHASLEYIKSPAPELHIIDVHHLHLWSMKTYFGTAGRYAHIEIEQQRRRSYAGLRFFKRFVVSEILLLPRRLWRERRSGVAVLLWLTLMSSIVCLLGFICWLEQRFLKKPEKQLEDYAKFYTD